MLCAPSSEVYDRLTLMLTNVSIVAGLVLSSIAGVALSPLNVQSFPPDKQLLAEVYNVMAAVAVITQLMVVLYSTCKRQLVSIRRPLGLPLAAASARFRMPSAALADFARAPSAAA